MKIDVLLKKKNHMKQTNKKSSDFFLFFSFFSSTSLLLQPIFLHPLACVLSHEIPWTAARRGSSIHGLFQ